MASHVLKEGSLTVSEYILLSKVGRINAGFRVWGKLKRIARIGKLPTGKYHVVVDNDINSPYYLNIDDKLEVL